MFGYVVRTGDVSGPATLDELHRMVRAGLNFQAVIQQRFDSIDANLIDLRSNQKKSPPPPEVALPEIFARLNQAASAAVVIEEPYLALGAWPSTLSELKTVFKSDPATIGYKMAHPPKTRSNGFGIQAGLPSQP